MLQRFPAEAAYFDFDFSVSTSIELPKSGFGDDILYRDIRKERIHRETYYRALSCISS